MLWRAAKSHALIVPWRFCDISLSCLKNDLLETIALQFVHKISAHINKHIGQSAHTLTLLLHFYFFFHSLRSYRFRLFPVSICLTLSLYRQSANPQAVKMCASPCESTSVSVCKPSHSKAIRFIYDHVQPNMKFVNDVTMKRNEIKHIKRAKLIAYKVLTKNTKKS